MSADTNKALVHRYIQEVCNQRNMAVLDELLAPSYVCHDPDTPDMGVGPESVKRNLNLYLTAFPDAQFTIEDMIAEGDRVVTRWTVRGTHKADLKGIAPTGRRVTVTGITTCRFSNGKMIEAFENWDSLGLMQQIGAAQTVEQEKGRAARYTG